MLYSNTNYKEWAKTYNLVPVYKECPCCHKEFLTTVPFAIKGYRGLQTEKHECGEAGVISIIKPIDNNEKDKWNDLII